MILSYAPIIDRGPPKGDSKSRFHAGFSHKSRPEIAWNSCSRQVYPITLDARLIFHAITQLFSPNSRFHAMKYVQSRHHAFPLGGPINNLYCIFHYRTIEHPSDNICKKFCCIKLNIEGYTAVSVSVVFPFHKCSKSPLRQQKPPISSYYYLRANVTF